MSLDDIIRQLWHEHCDSALRLADELVALASAAEPSIEARERGHRAAHQLAGSLGMYGMADGSELAGQLEDHLLPGADASIDATEFARIAGNLRRVVLHGPR
ncbi:MAG: Hpt domain-containing protein [Actinomycetota bacterium]|nr:Hpt domain-containing protein [Actinomycetota bacterium]